MRHLSVLTLALALCGLWISTHDVPETPSSTSPPPGAPDGAWRQADVWNDGNAEFSVYSVTWPRYGHKYQGTAYAIVVKEPWNPRLEVKADRPGADSFDVIKLNHVRDVRTGIYAYHQMASVFVRRDDGSVRKIAATSSEACGLSTSDMTGGKLRTRSYFDGQGSRTSDWPKAAWPEDGLAVHLRDYVTGTPPKTIDIFPTLMTGRFAPLAATAHTVTRTEGRIEVPAGTFDAVTLVLEAKGRRLAYTFEKALPHRLLHFRSSDGTEYRMVKSERLPYWRMNRPGGEFWIPEELR